MTIAENKYAGNRRNYMEQAEGYLWRGDLVQASEKSWVTAACAPMSIAEQRGWHHQSHILPFDISGQVAEELGRPYLRDLFAVAKPMQQIFYENWEPSEEVEYAVGRLKEYLVVLETVTSGLPPSFAVDTRAQRCRLARLTGQSDPL